MQGENFVILILFLSCLFVNKLRKMNALVLLFIYLNQTYLPVDENW